MPLRRQGGDRHLLALGRKREGQLTGDGALSDPTLAGQDQDDVLHARQSFSHFRDRYAKQNETHSDRIWGGGVVKTQASGRMLATLEIAASPREGGHILYPMARHCLKNVTASVSRTSTDKKKGTTSKAQARKVRAAVRQHLPQDGVLECPYCITVNTVLLNTVLLYRVLSLLLYIGCVIPGMAIGVPHHHRGVSSTASFVELRAVNVPAIPLRKQHNG